jgi:hypothetical protein
MPKQNSNRWHGPDTAVMTKAKEDTELQIRKGFQARTELTPLELSTVEYHARPKKKKEKRKKKRKEKKRPGGGGAGADTRRSDFPTVLGARDGSHSRSQLFARPKYQYAT